MEQEDSSVSPSRHSEHPDNRSPDERPRKSSTGARKLLIIGVALVLLLIGLVEVYTDLLLLPAKHTISKNPVMLGSPSFPEPRKQPFWLPLHESYVKRAQAGNIGVLFLGDSITQFINKYPDLLKTYFPGKQAEAFGEAGDGTQHLLWRLQHGEVDRLNPHVVVLMIGTNNVPYYKDKEIIDGMGTIVSDLKKRLPQSRILLLALLPRGFSTHNELRPRIEPLNRALEILAKKKAIEYADVGSVFLESHGRLRTKLMPDGLHPSLEGYKAMFAALGPTINKLWD